MLRGQGGRKEPENTGRVANDGVREAGGRVVSPGPNGKGASGRREINFVKFCLLCG